MIIKIIKPLIRYFKSYLSLKGYLSYRRRVGTAKRQEYWRMLAIVIACNFLESAMRSTIHDGFDFKLFITSTYFIPWFLLLCFYLPFFLRTAFRRCEDIGISHWYVFLVFIDYINIALIIMLGVLETGSGKKIRELKEFYFGKKKNKKKIKN